MKKYVLISISALMIGCSTTNPQKSVQPHHLTQNKATSIIGSWKRKTLLDWEGFGIAAIDNKFVSLGLFGSYDTTSFKLSKGRHSIVVTSEFNRGAWNSCPYQARAKLLLNVEENHQYIVRGRVKDERIVFWIEDKITHKRVTRTVSKSYYSEPQIVYMPIYI